VIKETLVHPTTPPSPTKACVMATYSKPLPNPKFDEQAHEQAAQPNVSVKNANRPVSKASKGAVDLGFKNKRDGRLILRKL
jgi:hypothetical protein